MTENGTHKQKEIKILPIETGEVHLQNILKEPECYICKCTCHEDMAVLRISGKQMGFACLHHSGVVQEFIRQFHRPPLGWVKVGEDYALGETLGKDESQTRVASS